MNRIINVSRPRRAWVVLIILVLCVVHIVPAYAVQPAPAPQAETASVAAQTNATIGLEINFLDFAADRMIVNMTMRAVNLQDEDMTMVIFVFFDDDRPIMATDAAPPAFRTTRGGLAYGERFSPGFQDTIWDEVVYEIPYAYFPRVDRQRGAYVVAAATVEGFEGVITSERSYFRISP
ncbi:MAG: hypothetical protein ACLFTK_15365 [Anaerolineales bacterium]